MTESPQFDPNDLSYETVYARLKGCRIALIGGAGFIGHNLALELARAGAQVLVVDNLMVNNFVDHLYGTQPHKVQSLAYQGFLLDRFTLMRDAGVRLANADARNYMDLANALQEFSPEKLVHLSAISSAVEAARNPGLCFDLQLITLRNLLEWVRANMDIQRQVMFLSSSTVYGDFETPTVDESVRPKPKGIYANAKYMGERLMRTYRHSHGLPITIIRPSALYGERCISRRVSQVFIENALQGKPLLLEGGGDGRLDFTYIEDLVEGMVRALALPEGVSTTLNITFGNARTIAELAAVVQQVVPNVILEDRPRAELKPIRGTLSIERAATAIGFKAKWKLEDGYLRYCQWYADQWERAKKKLG